MLVAGGLGERLGYSGIKIALPAQTVAPQCYLALYAEQILALQARTSHFHAIGGVHLGGWF